MHKKTSLTKQATLNKTLKAKRRDDFFKEVNAAYDALKNDPIAWQEELRERAEWESFNDIALDIMLVQYASHNDD